MGRPTKFNEAIAAKILAQIATTREGLAAICKSNKGFPSPRSVYLWLLQDKEFSQKYAQAKEDQLQVLEDEILEIADTPQLGEIVTEKPVVFEGSVVKIKGKTLVQREVKQADMIEHRKLRIESRKWLMGKLKPKKYGEKLAHTGADGKGPVQHHFVVERIGPPVNPDEVEK